MNKYLYIIIGVLIPFIGTCLGSFFVFFLKNKISNKLKKLMIGFASGIMIAASVWSLIIPSIEMVENTYKLKWLPATIGFIIGIVFLIIINIVANRINTDRNPNMLLFSVTVHNIPEGMAVGVVYAGLLAGNIYVDLISAITLSIGIAIQNIPEGMIISLPLKMNGYSKRKSFVYGMLSGIVEPIAALITILLLKIILPLLPYLLSFASGAMIYVVIEELIPEMHEDYKSIIGIIGLTIGFVIMMILDVSLS